MKTSEVHNPLFRESAICLKCHEKEALQSEPPKMVEKVKKNYNLTKSGKTFLIRITGIVIIMLCFLIVELCLFHGWTWSITAWFVQFVIGFFMTCCAHQMTSFEPLVKITTNKTPKPGDYEYRPELIEK